MASAKSLEDLAKATYRDERYASEKPETIYDRLESAATSLQPLFAKYLPQPSNNGPSPHILHLGRGKSRLPLDMLAADYNNQLCVDFSAVVIEDMATRVGEIQWKTLDVRDMEGIGDGVIDVAIDKSTLDAMVSGDLWNLPDGVRNKIGRYIDEVARGLKIGGVFVCVSFTQPHFVRPLLARNGDTL